MCAGGAGLDTHLEVESDGCVCVQAKHLWGFLAGKGLDVVDAGRVVAVARGAPVATGAEGIAVLERLCMHLLRRVHNNTLFAPRQL